MEEEIGRLCEVLPTRPEVKVASVFSHLNCADKMCIRDRMDVAGSELEFFKQRVSRLTDDLSRTLDLSLIHILNTAWGSMTTGPLPSGGCARCGGFFPMPSWWAAGVRGS